MPIETDFMLAWEERFEAKLSSDKAGEDMKLPQPKHWADILHNFCPSFKKTQTSGHFWLICKFYWCLDSYAKLSLKGHNFISMFFFTKTDS